MSLRVLLTFPPGELFATSHLSTSHPNRQFRPIEKKDFTFRELRAPSTPKEMEPPIAPRWSMSVGLAIWLSRQHLRFRARLTMDREINMECDWGMYQRGRYWSVRS